MRICSDKKVNLSVPQFAMSKLKNKIRAMDSKIYSQDLINVLFRGPIIYANQLVEHGVVGSLSTAHTYLKKLSDEGLLKKSDKRYNRKVGFVNADLVEALRGEIDLS